MRHELFRVFLLGLALASACADTNPPAAPSSPAIGGDGARIHRADTGRLTAASPAIADEVVRSYLHGYVGGAADQLALVSRSAPRNGITHVRYEQVVGGLRVYGAYARAAISDRGELVQVIEKLAPAVGSPRAAAITHEDALAVAMKRHGYDFATPARTSARGHELGFDKGTAFYRDPTVERVAYVDGGALKEGFLVETWSYADNQLDHTLVSGNGAIVRTERRTANDSYNVFTNDPLKTPQAVVAGPGAGNAESPAGWLAGDQLNTNITGNNVHAYLDADRNNRPDRGGTAVTDGNFLQAADLSVAPTTAGNRAVAVQNLFFLNNFVHDITYRHGFDEAAGNFQEDNFGNGGAGSDSVNAEAQDGGGTDNANFSTPTDGRNPRMQMYLWSGVGPDAQVTAGGATYPGKRSSFGAAFPADGVNGTLALVNDGTGTATDGCEANTTSLAGQIALVDRGACNFTVKVLNAQTAGAIAVVIANNDTVSPDSYFSAGGTERRIRIPSLMVSYNAGQALRGAVGQAATAEAIPPPIMIDGSLDSDIVYHEFGHGLTWRMIGGMSGPMAGAVGEGMSDVLAMLINGDDRVAEYSFSDAGGIRRYPYADYPLSYGDMNSGEVHNDGEAYGAIGWRLIELFGSRRDVLFGYIIDGMNYTPATPAYEDMRDGILQAVQAAGGLATDTCLVWQAFAQYGVGVGADGTTSAPVTITESFAVPASCQ